MWSEGMWFGTLGHMRWVPCPSVGADMAKQGWQSKQQYLNGGAYVRRSTTAHKEYSLSWGLQSRNSLRPINDYADGIYGDGLIFFVDPFAADMNVAPQYWGAPMLGADDAPLLTGTELPYLVSTPVNSLHYPSKSAIYLVDPEAPKLETFIPVPPGYTAHVGAHGTDVTGSAVVHVVQVSSAGGDGAATSLTLLPVDTTTRFNASFAGNDGGGIKLRLGGTGTITLTAVMVQILRTGVTPELGGFISGQGNSGCHFESQPTLQNYSSALDKVAMTAKLVEVGAWE